MFAAAPAQEQPELPSSKEEIWREFGPGPVIEYEPPVLDQDWDAEAPASPAPEDEREDNLTAAYLYGVQVEKERQRAASLPAGWTIKRKTAFGVEALCVWKDGIGGYAAKASDTDIAKVVLYHLAADILAQAETHTAPLPAPLTDAQVRRLWQEAGGSPGLFVRGVERELGIGQADTAPAVGSTADAKTSETDEPEGLVDEGGLSAAYYSGYFKAAIKQRRQPLSDEQIMALLGFARAVEQAHGIGQTGDGEAA